MKPEKVTEMEARGKKKKEEHGKFEKIMFTCIMIFLFTFLRAVTSSHVLHLDALRSQIELKLKVKTIISLCMAIMQNNPLPSQYGSTVYIGMALVWPAL